MRGIHRFLRWHPVWSAVIGIVLSLLLIAICIFSGMKIYKMNHPNDIYYDEDGLICNSTTYVHLLNNWEFTEETDVYIGTHNGGKYSLFPFGKIYRAKSDSEAMFIEDKDNGKGWSGPLYYVKKENNINLFDHTQISKIELWSKEETIEFTKEKTKTELLHFFKEVKEQKYTESQKHSAWDKKYNIDLYLKEYPVRYNMGTLYINDEEDVWVFEVKELGSKPTRYTLPDEVKAQLKGDI